MKKATIYLSDNLHFDVDLESKTFVSNNCFAYNVIVEEKISNTRNSRGFAIYKSTGNYLIKGIVKIKEKHIKAI